MKKFLLTSSIPTSSGTDIMLKNETLFFASGSTLYNPSMFFHCHDPIVSFDISKHIFVLTEKELLQLDRFGRILTKMKMLKRCRQIKCHGSKIFLFKNNCIEAYKIPNTYSNVAYVLLKRLFIEQLVVKSSFYENYMVTSHETNAVYFFDIQEGKEILIGTFLEDIINVFIIESKIYIICRNSIIIYNYSVDHSQENFVDKCIEKKIKMDNIVYAAYNNATNTLYIGYPDGEGKHIVSLLRGFEIIETIDSKFSIINQFAVEGNIIALKGDEEIQQYNLSTKLVLDSIDVSNIQCYNTYRDLVFIASQRSIKIYRNERLIRKHTLDIETKIVFIHGSKNIILTVSSLGTVRLYDTNKFYCFKSFDLPFNVLATDVNEDMSLLFFASTSIFVYDMKKGKQIDELTGHTGPIIKLIYKNGYIYSFGLDNVIRKQYIFDTTKQAQEVVNLNNKTIIDFAVCNNLYMLYDNEICVFDNRLDFVQTLYIKNNKKITFEKLAVVNECFVAVYGKYRNYKDETITTVQIYNMDFSVKIQEFECEPIDKISSFNSKFILQSNSFIYFYGQKSLAFDPVDLEIDCNSGKVQEHLKNNNFYSALMCSLKLQDEAIIKDVIAQIPIDGISEIVRSLPYKYATLLRLQLCNMQDFRVEWIKYIAYYHTNNGKQIKLNEKQLNIYQKMRENKYILDVLISENKQ